MKRKIITIGILVGLTIGLYFLFAQFKPLRIFTKDEIRSYHIKDRTIAISKRLITKKEKTIKSLPIKSPKDDGIDWKNWVLATLTSIVVYAIKKSIDLFFKMKELRLARTEPPGKTPG